LCPRARGPRTHDRQGLIAAAGTPERALLDALDLARLPRHVAVIMDGNGRWARKRRLPRVEGHRAGIDAVRATVETAARPACRPDLYAFSTENWKRPRVEVATLMTLLKEWLGRSSTTWIRNDIRFRVVGRMDGLDASVVRALKEGSNATAGAAAWSSTSPQLLGRIELVDAMRSLAADVAAGACSQRRSTRRRSPRAFTRPGFPTGSPHPDERRDADFELPPLAIAYAEIHVTPVLWPDFRRAILEALADFQKRERRYGGVLEPESDERPTLVRPWRRRGDAPGLRSSG